MLSCSWHSGHTKICVNCSRNIVTYLTNPFSTMVRGKHNFKESQTSADIKKQENLPIQYDKSKNILINILAKPGAKCNRITDISVEGVGIQINAPATEGEANSELLKYLCDILELRKANVMLYKGFKSKQKTVKLLDIDMTIEQVAEKLNSNR